jgi:hypothetical protein
MDKFVTKLVFHKDGTLPIGDEIFVFGSNFAGIHGAGAARVAYDSFGAKWGEGEGVTGDCYAIPTKDYSLKTLPLRAIELAILAFCDEAARWKHTDVYFVTRVGCGLAGYKDSDIAPLFKKCMQSTNFDFPENWKEYLL